MQRTESRSCKTVDSRNRSAASGSTLLILANNSRVSNVIVCFGSEKSCERARQRRPEANEATIRTRKARDWSCLSIQRPYFSTSDLSLDRHVKSNMLCRPSSNEPSVYSPSIILQRKSQFRECSQGDGTAHLDQMSSTRIVSPFSSRMLAKSWYNPASSSACSTCLTTQS